MDKIHHWTNHWPSIADRIEQLPNILLASDFDGTLTPIARTPMEAVLAAETRATLRQLAACPGVQLAVISGRALSDVQMHVGIQGIFYAGNHGLELSGPGIELHNPWGSKVRSDLEKVVAEMVTKTARFQGVIVEDKGATAAVHWRLAGEADRVALFDLVQTSVSAYPRLRLEAGKCVWEIRPKDGWNKGDALTHLAIRLGIDTNAVVYLGDDLTDENAFRVATDGMTFRVGGPMEKTAARFSIRDASDAQAFLMCALGVRSGQRTVGVPQSAIRHSPPLRSPTASLFSGLDAVSKRQS